MIMMSVQQMLDNMATASQHEPLTDDPVVVGAVLRSVGQWLNSNGDSDIGDLLIELVSHEDFGE